MIQGMKRSEEIPRFTTNTSSKVGSKVEGSRMSAFSSRVPQTLRTMTFNVHWGVGTDGSYNLARIATIINTENPDLVALQELHCNTVEFPDQDQPAILASLTEMHVTYVPSMIGCPQYPDTSGSYGNAILSRELPVKVESVQFPTGSGYSRSREPRAAIAVLTPQAPWFVCTHFGCDITGFEQCASVPILATFVKDLHPTTHECIVAGDFNAIRLRKCLSMLCDEHGWKDAWLQVSGGKNTYWDGCTMPSWYPIWRIDYVFHVLPSCDTEANKLRDETSTKEEVSTPSGNWKPLRGHVRNNPTDESVVASDHCAVIIDWEYRLIRERDQTNKPQN